MDVDGIAGRIGRPSSRRAAAAAGWAPLLEARRARPKIRALPAATITLTDGARRHTLSTKDFTQRELDTFLERNEERLTAQLRPLKTDTINAARDGFVEAYPALQNGGTLSAVTGPTTIAVNGLTAKVFEGGPNEHRSKTDKAIRTALTVFSASGRLRLPGDELDIYVCLKANFCLGYLYRRNMNLRAAVVLGRPAFEWTGDALTRGIAQEVYEHYQPTWTVNGTEKRILATLVHEMGHVFHQMTALPHYILLARAAEFGGSFNEETITTRLGEGGASLGDLSPRPSAPQLHSFVQRSRAIAAGVSPYASGSALNEFVAEVFSALVMDSPLGINGGVPVQAAPAITSTAGTSIEVAEAYAACAGPMPETAICHKRK
jgi:hypothetical protein